MATAIGPDDQAIVLKFGGGVHSRASSDEIDPRECFRGQNFALDLEDRNFRNRKPFDLIGTVPNAAEIRGFANLYKTDGTSSVLVQAGANVYEWDGVSTFTLVGTVNSEAQIRGRLSHNWQLTDKVIITDLNLQEAVYEWDGTTFQAVTFTDEVPNAFGTFKARYCVVSNERAIFSNISEPTGAFPHLIVGSARGDYTQISVSQRPASGVTLTDPWFIVQPDNRYINGMADFYGTVITSSRKGSLFKLSGSDATDFQMDPFYPRSGVTGGESLTNIGNDILYARSGRIESLLSTDRFGDVATDDLSNGIDDLINTFDEWTIVYNERTQRVYCIPAEQAQVWVYHKTMRDMNVSAWSKWVTAHSSSFQPTAIMNMIDPVDGLEYVFFGDASGNFYRLEGSGTAGDGGTASVSCERLSGLFSAPLDSEAYTISGWIKYYKGNASTVTLRIEYQGMNVFNESITINIPADSARVYYGGSNYYSGESYYGSFSDKVTRQRFALPGGSNEFQLRVTVEGTADFVINEIGLRFEAAS